MENLGIDEIAMHNRTLSANDIAILYYYGTQGIFCTGNPCKWRTSKFTSR